MSLCRIDCRPRLSHLRVTPDQLASVTVPWSPLSSRQQTRALAFRSLESGPVISIPVVSGLRGGPHYPLVAAMARAVGLVTFSAKIDRPPAWDASLRGIFEFEHSNVGFTSDRQDGITNRFHFWAQKAPLQHA
jgi:hypothetical protein